jgi:hypothetical protein
MSSGQLEKVDLVMITANRQDHRPGEDGDDSFIDSDLSDDYNSNSDSYEEENSNDYSRRLLPSEELEGSDSSPSSEEESSDDSSEKDSDGGSLLKFHVQHSGSKKSSACGGPSLG